MSMLTDAEQMELLGADGPITEKATAIAKRIAQEQGEIAIERVLKEILPYLVKVDEVSEFVSRLKRNLLSAAKGR